MRESFEDYLFSHHILVCGEADHALEVLASLAKLFGVYVSEGAELLGPRAIAICERNLSGHVPEPFYRGFPTSVLLLPQDDLVWNQMLHYLFTYELGDFSETGHAMIEERLERVALNGAGRVLRLRAVSEDEAERMVCDEARLLLASTRPISDVQLDLVANAIADFDLDDVSCASRDTAARLVCRTWDERLYRLLSLPDVLRVVEWHVATTHQGRGLKSLNLCARARRHVSAVLDYLFEHGAPGARACLERRRLWRGLLHHLHYRPKVPQAQDFVDMVFADDERSDTAAFEALMAQGDTVGAARRLRADKGPTAVARSLNYLLSRTRDEAEVDEVISLIAGCRKVVLIQLALAYARRRAADAAAAPRVFRFTRLGLECVHEETADEVARRRSAIAPELQARVEAGVRALLEDACAGTLGRVYVDPAMRLTAVPLTSSTAQGGFGALPAGSRVPIEGLGPEGCVRAFCWWEGVDDIDLACFGLGGDTVYEFSWRTMALLQSGVPAVIFSGDETSGYRGGSEYFDIDVAGLRKTMPDVRYVVVFANVFTGTPFSACTCRAGYMLRERPASGEVYEPSTVASSLTVACNSTFAQLFAIDLERFEVVWLNIARAGHVRVAGTRSFDYLMDVLSMCDIVNLADLARMMATEVVGTPEEADVVVSDAELALAPDQEQIRSTDTARVMALIEA